MTTLLTRAELNDELGQLRSRPAEISSEMAEDEQAEAVTTEAEGIEQLFRMTDWIYFHQQVEAIIWAAPF